MADIALGMQSGDDIPGLEWFAAQVNALPMSRWLEVGLYDDDVEGWGPAFHQAVTRTLDAGYRIHFSLDGVSIREALGGDSALWVGRYNGLGTAANRPEQGVV
jgi:hypothetical protein